MDVDEELDERNTIAGEIEALVSNLDAEEAKEYLDGLVQKWRLQAPPATFRDTANIQLQNFGIDSTGSLNINDDGSYGLRNLKQEIVRQEMEAIALYHRLRYLSLLSEQDIASRMQGVLESLFLAKKSVLGMFQAKLVEQRVSRGVPMDLDEDLDMQLGSWAVRFRWLGSDNITDTQKVMLHVLDAAMERKYRKQDGKCFEPITVNNYNTHAWKFVCEIPEFVYECCTKETQLDQWLCLTSGTNNAKAVIEYLINCNDFQFRKLVKDRTVFAFRNGVYLARQDLFHIFADESRPPLSDSIVAAKFFDLDVDALMTAGWRHIPTPYFDSILEYQQFPREVMDWMFVLIGRLLYPVGELDGWQVIPFLKGQAGSGKCFGAGTKVLMHDASVKKIEDVRVGDRVMGEDGTPRTVMTLARGHERLYRIEPIGVEVTLQHVLCLRFMPHASPTSNNAIVFAYKDQIYRTTRLPTQTVCNGMYDTVEMTVEEYLSLTPGFRKYWRMYRVGLPDGVENLPSRKDRAAMLAGMMAMGGWDKAFLATSLLESHDMYEFDIHPVDIKPYYGIQILGNQRFLLHDCTVTHNSTIIKVCKDLYDTVDVGVLSNNIEKKFGLSAFWNKLLFVAPEIKADLQIEQAEFQSIVSGEDVQVAIKHKKAFSTKWSVPGVLAGNEIPGFADNSGSIQRRVCVFAFERPVTQGDMRLGEKLETEMAALLLKCNKAYLEASSMYGQSNIWTILPDYFLGTRNEMAATTNSVEAFLGSTDIVLDADKFMPFEDFKMALRMFETSNGYRNSRYVADFFKTPFIKFNIRRERCIKVYRGRRLNTEFLIGVDIENQMMNEAGDLL